MASGDRFLLTLNGDYHGILWKNVFGYRHDTGSSTAAALGSVFDASVLNALRDMQATSCNYNTIEVINLDEPTDFATVIPTITNGTDVGDGLPAFVCTAFLIARQSRLVRNGWKRFTGVTEPMVDGQNLASAYQTKANALAGQLTTYLGTVEGDAWYPQIVRRTIVNGVTQYTFFEAGTVSFSKISTQNTRKD